MFYKRVLVVLLCASFLSAQAFAQTKPTQADGNKAAPISPELLEKSVSLLDALAREAEQFGLPENRVKARALTANLLWEHDEKQARRIFQAAVSEMNSIIGQLSLDETDDETEAAENSLSLEEVKQMRSELLVTLAARDPKFALDSLSALNRRNAGGESIFTDDGALELSLVEKIAEKDPKQAFELAEKNLQAGLGYNLFSALESIYEKDADLGARLAQSVLGKIKSRDARIISSSDYSAMSNGIITNTGTMSNRSGAAQETSFTANVWEVQRFLQSIKKLNRQALKDKKTPALTDAEIKDLVGILAEKYVKQQFLSPYEVAQVMPDITRYFPASAQAIRAKMMNGASGAAELENQIRVSEIQGETEDKTAEEVFQIAEKKPVAERDKFYRQAAERAFEEGDIARAKDFYARVKKREEYDYLGTKIDEGLPLALAQKGDMSAVRQALAKLKTPEQRIEILSALAQSVAQNGDKKIALTLVTEARAQYSGRMKQRRNLTSLLQLAQAYAVVEPEQSFVMLESNLSYFNDLIAAGILLDDFNEYGSVKSDEASLDTVRSESYRSAPGGVSLIKKLAAADFDRSVALADRFARPETKFFARFRIVEALLDPNAEDTEKQIQQSEERGID